jgi:hypothetical protein
VADPNRDEGFKVVDRRLFTESGELRKDVAENERRVQETSAAGSAGAVQPQVPPDAPAAAVESVVEAYEPSRSFQMLVDFLTRNAAAMLGGMADPRTGQAFLDLEGAREMIDMMDTLREKTRGNLAKADEDLLLEVIGSLKLTYMEVSKAAAAQMKKAGTKK